MTLDKAFNNQPCYVKINLALLPPIGYHIINTLLKYNLINIKNGMDINVYIQKNRRSCWYSSNYLYLRPINPGNKSKTCR